MADEPSTTVTGDTLEKQLEKKQTDFAAAQGQLKTAQDQIGTLNQQLGTLQNDIKGLQAQLADVKQATGGYDKAGSAQKDELDKDQKFIDTKKQIAEAVLKDLKDDVDKKVNDFDSALNKKQQDATDALKAATDATTAASGADAAAQDKQTAYDTLKKLPTDNAAQLKEITSLLDQVSKAETQNDFVAVYFLAQEAGKIVSQLKIPSADDYMTQVRQAQQDASDAKATASAKKSDADKLMATWRGLHDTHAAAQKSRRDDLLALLKSVKPKTV
jgi:septal ring factor EnvC (AmiA/AmiB activator)